MSESKSSDSKVLGGQGSTNQKLSLRFLPAQINLTGQWKQESEEGFEAYLKALGELHLRTVSLDANAKTVRLLFAFLCESA